MPLNVIPWPWMTMDDSGRIVRKTIFAVSSINDDPTQIDTDASDGKLI